MKNIFCWITTLCSVSWKCFFYFWCFCRTLPPPLTLPLLPGNSACYTAGDGEVTLLGNVTSAEAHIDHVNITISGESGVTTRVTLLCGNSLVSTLQFVCCQLILETVPELSVLDIRELLSIVHSKPSFDKPNSVNKRFRRLRLFSFTCNSWWNSCYQLIRIFGLV